LLKTIFLLQINVMTRHGAVPGWRAF